jgi:2-polyprenyl-6-methoxyphenol hydroxylase-like FAD-dependent oxidoreductase
MIVGIAGAGMGGLAAATMLARDGHRVVLHDRMDRPGPVGSGFVLQPTGLAVLGDMGLRRDVEARGAAIHRMLGLVRPSGRTVLDVGYPDGLNGLAVQRAALFDVLLEAATSSGVEFETSRTIASVSDDGRSFTMIDGSRTCGFDLLVDAMGSGTPLRRCRSRELSYGALWATVPWKADGAFDPSTLEQRYLGASRMAGVLPVGTACDDADPKATFFWSVRREEDPRTDLARWHEDVHRLWPEAVHLLEGAQPVMARYRHHTHSRPVEGRLVRIGDSFHSTSPQLGQGANMALIDAIALRTALRRGSGTDEALASYVASRRLHIAFYQALSVVLTPFYQSDSRMLPILRDHVIAPLLRRRGIVHAMIAAMVTGGVLDPVGRATRQCEERTIARP